MVEPQDTASTATLADVTRPALSILPMISDAWDLEIPTASPIPSWVTSRGTTREEWGLRCL